MALQGTLETFSISEIFQLVSQQGKTGTLEIRTADGTARIRFSHGHLVEAWPDRRTPSELIGSLLVRAGLIASAQLEHALQEQSQNLRPLGDLLIRMGALRVNDFQEVLSLQHRETVYRLLRLTRGSYRFVSEPVEVEDGVSSPLEVGALLMEGFRQIDEWPKVLARIPSEQHVYARCAAGPVEGLTRAEAQVLALVDGTATVREIVDRARVGEFPGWEALAGLFDRGAIAPVEAVRPTAPRPPRPARSALADRLAAALLLALAVALGMARFPVGLETWSSLASSVAEARREAREAGERSVSWAGRAPHGWPVPVRR